MFSDTISDCVCCRQVQWKQNMAGLLYYCCLVISECTSLLIEFTAANWKCRDVVRH